MMRFLFRFEEWTVKGEKALIVLFVALMIALSFLQVLLRVFFHSGIVWLDPVLRHMVLWSGLLGTALASRYSRQFALEALVKFAPEKVHRPLAIFAGSFTVAVSGLLFWAAWKFVRDDFASASTSFYIGHFAVPSGWAHMIIPAVFVLIIFHTVMNLFRVVDPGEEFRF
ncbi:MAG: TRAP transporter small permease subunit [Elusimicrobiales bacterium]|jgi:TRAP-type C4-dicarboxylate transport system permease small subunit|nr:TRAP transporter small permease subunit [Elusimicrobiales bacterium]